MAFMTTTPGSENPAYLADVARAAFSNSTPRGIGRRTKAKVRTLRERGAYLPQDEEAED